MRVDKTERCLDKPAFPGKVFPTELGLACTVSGLSLV